MSSGGAWRVATKIAASQLFANPFCYLPTFYLWTGVVFGRTLAETKEKAKREYWATLRATWAVLGSANVIMFTRIPVAYHATFIGVASFIYQNVLSLLANRDRVQQLQQRRLSENRTRTE